MTSISAVLASADARLTPETWTQQPAKDHRMGLIGKECVYIAIDHATTNRVARRTALDLFAQLVSGSPDAGSADIFLWNDAPTTTLADVHTAFAASIAIAKSQEQSVREEVPCAG